MRLLAAFLVVLPMLALFAARPAESVELQPGDIVVIGGGGTDGAIVRIDPDTGSGELIADKSTCSEFANLVPDAVSIGPRGDVLVTLSSGGLSPGALLRVDPADGSCSVLAGGDLGEIPFLPSIQAIAVTQVPLSVDPSPPGTGTVPLDVSYQGQLLDASGAPLNGTVSIQARLYSNEVVTPGETPLFVEDHTGVSVAEGVFSILLGQGTAVTGTMNAGLFADGERYLEVHVNGERLDPRQAISSVPYALQAENASTIGGLTATQLLDTARASAPVLHVFDTHGNDLGILVDSGDDLSVFNPGLQRSYTIDSVPETGGPLQFSSVFRVGLHGVLYVDTDCVGQAYAPQLFGGLIAGLIVTARSDLPDGQTHTFETDPSGATTQTGRTFESRRDSPSGDCVNTSSSISGNTIAAEPFDPATFGFPYPIEGPLRIGLAP